MIHFHSRRRIHRSRNSAENLVTVRYDRENGNGSSIRLMALQTTLTATRAFVSP